MSTTNNEEQGPGSPAPATKSEAELVKRTVKKGHDIAKRVVEYSYDYKGKTQAQLKSLLQERDSEMFILAEEFLDQEAKIQRLKAASQRKTREVAEMKQQAKESGDINSKLTEALLKSVSKADTDEPIPGSSSEPEGGEANSANNSGDEGPAIAGEPKALFSLPEYQERIRHMNLDELVMTGEAENMVPAMQAPEAVNGVVRYPVPFHLMGLVIGRQKATLNRIINQTSTEIEPVSWVEDNIRHMGFYILGSPEAVRSAINEMIAAVRNMDKFRAKNIIKSHMSYKPGGGKSAKLCRHFSKGHCKLGNKCRFTHKKPTKK